MMNNNEDIKNLTKYMYISTKIKPKFRQLMGFLGNGLAVLYYDWIDKKIEIVAPYGLLKVTTRSEDHHNTCTTFPNLTFKDKHIYGFASCCDLKNHWFHTKAKPFAFHLHIFNYKLLICILMNINENINTRRRYHMHR